jgi:hypothetical protein
MNSFRLFSVMLILSSLLISCAKTEEGQRKKWAYNMERVDMLIQKHPNFADVIKEVKSNAEHVFADALTTPAGDEEKVNKMIEANRVLNASFIVGLKSLDSKSEEARKLSREIIELSPGESSALIAAISGNNLEQEITNMLETIRGANPTNVTGANIIVEDAMKPLNEYIKEMKKIVSDLKKMNEPVEEEPVAQ